MKLIKNAVQNLIRVGGIYVALKEPFNRGWVFIISKIDKKLCWRNGGTKEQKCPFPSLEERAEKCQGIMVYGYKDESADLNYKCLAHVLGRFRVATPSERELDHVDI